MNKIFPVAVLAAIVLGSFTMTPTVTAEGCDYDDVQCIRDNIRSNAYNWEKMFPPECDKCPPGPEPYWKDLLIITAASDYKVEELIQKVEVLETHILADTESGGIPEKFSGDGDGSPAIMDGVIIGLVSIAIGLGIVNLVRKK